MVDMQRPQCQESTPFELQYSMFDIILQNSAFQPSRGRLLYIHPVVIVGCRRHVLLPLIRPP